MELESLKSEWKSYTKRQEEDLNLSGQGLQRLFRSKVRGALKIIRRNMWIDSGVMLASTMAFIGIVFWFRFELRFVTSAILLATAVVLAFHFYIKHKALSPLDLSQDSLVPAVEKLIQQLERYMLLYLWSIPLITALTYIAVNSYLFYFVRHDSALTGLFWQDIALALPIVGTSFLVARWLAKLMYGQHLEALKSNYEDFLRDTESPEKTL